MAAFKFSFTFTFSGVIREVLFPVPPGINSSRVPSCKCEQGDQPLDTGDMSVTHSRTSRDTWPFKLMLGQALTKHHSKDIMLRQDCRSTRASNLYSFLYRRCCIVQKSDEQNEALKLSVGPAI